MLSSSGLGHTGPDRDHVAYGSLLQCFTGWSGQTGYPGGRPLIGGVWSDPLTGMMQTFLVAAALRNRERTGEGMYIDLAMAEAMCTLLPEAFMDYAMNGRVAAPNGNSDSRYAPHNLYPCKGDDAWVAIAVTDDSEWRALCEVIGEPDLAIRYGDVAARRTHVADIDARIADWTARLTPEEAVRLLQPRVPAGPSLNAMAALNDPHLAERGFFLDSAGPEGARIRLPGVPWRIDGLVPFTGAATELGDQNRDVLRELLGLSDADIEALEVDGTLH
jgi:crotonobetainyl-CoA:carnitine CoA-transferase CaiB-like acyl-CoA transferase